MYLVFSGSLRAKYRLIIWTYRQGQGGKPEISDITNPSLHSIPIKIKILTAKQDKRILIK